MRAPQHSICLPALPLMTQLRQLEPGLSTQILVIAPPGLIRECISRKQLGCMAQRKQIPAPQPFGPQGSPESFPLPHLSSRSSGTPGTSQSWVKHREGVTTVAAGP